MCYAKQNSLPIKQILYHFYYMFNRETYRWHTLLCNYVWDLGFVCEHVYTGLIGTIRVILVYEADDFYLLKVFVFNENVIHFVFKSFFMYFILKMKSKV